MRPFAQKIVACSRGSCFLPWHYCAPDSNTGGGFDVPSNQDEVCTLPTTGFHRRVRSQEQLDTRQPMQSKYQSQTCYWPGFQCLGLEAPFRVGIKLLSVNTANAMNTGSVCMLDTCCTYLCDDDVQTR